MKIIYISLIAFIVVLNANAQWFGRTKNLPSAQQILEKLNTYYTNSVKEIYNPEVFKPGKNVNDTIKSKLISLLRDYWTEDELTLIIESKFKQDFEYIFFQGIVEKTMARSSYVNLVPKIDLLRSKDPSLNYSDAFRLLYDSIYNSIFDSTALAYRQELRKSYSKRQVPDEIIKSVATANVREAIPILKEALDSGNPLFNKDATELALARFGDKKYQEKIIKECLNNIGSNNVWNYSKKLAFINTQESIYQMHVFMDSTLKINRRAGNQSTLIYSGGKAIIVMLYTIINKDIQNKFKDVELDYLEDKELLLFAKNWLIKNKGKYEIYQSFMPFD